MMTNVETVLRQSFEALNGCAMALRFPDSFFHLHDLDSAYSDENNYGDDDKNNGGENYHQHNNNTSNDSHNSPSHGTVTHRRSENQASVRSSAGLGAGEEQGGELRESSEPDCTICYRKFGTVEDDHWFTEYGILYNCQHSFCLCCIQRWLRQFAFENRKCPVCRCQSVFCVSSPRWLPHNSPDKDSLVCCSPRWAMVQQLVTRCLSALTTMASLHIKLCCDAIKSMVAELILDQEGLCHRHEIMSMV